MKTLGLLPFIFIVMGYNSFTQELGGNKKQIKSIIETYSKSVIDKDSTTFYALFNDGPVTWCAALKDRSTIKENEGKGAAAARSNYFSGSHKGFFRGLYNYASTEDKFDNIRIIEDGTVATVSMDYSFWANKKMTNWGGKYLTLIKRDGRWKITSVIYSVELADYYQQPTLKLRSKTE